MSKISRKSVNASELIKSKDKFRLPECQRNLDNDQVNKMLAYQTQYYKKYSEYFFPTPIVIGVVDDNYYVIDGQHRYECITYLYTDENDFSVPVSLITISDMEELDEMYSRINSNKPVPIINDFQEWKNFTKFIEKELLSNCRDYISTSKRPQVPNINTNTIVEYLNENKIGEKVDFDYKRFITEIWKLNTYISRTYETSIVDYFNSNITKYIKKSKDKNHDNPFFLGIFKKMEWVDFIVKSINNNIGYNEMNLTPRDLRVKIKKPTRTAVWKKRFNSMSGKCYVCEESISYDNFDCGHIVSVFNLGCTEVSNMEPICSSCNINMGIQNLQEYKRQLQKELM